MFRDKKKKTFWGGGHRRYRRETPELLQKQWGNIRREGNQKVGVDADKFGGTGEKAEGIQIQIFLFSQVGSFPDREGDRELWKNTSMFTENYGHLETGDQQQVKDYLSISEK